MASPAVSVGTAAKELGVSTGTVRNWIEKGYLTAVRFPSGHRRIPESEMNRMLAELFHAPFAPEATDEQVPLRLGVEAPPEDDEPPVF